MRLTNQVWIGQQSYPGTPKMLKRRPGRLAAKLAKKRKAWTMHLLRSRSDSLGQGNQNGYCEIIR